MSRERLYHFTCDHGRKGIGRRGLIRPLTKWKLVWLTSDPNPARDDVGLTSETGLITCDRMSYRYIVDSHSAMPWSVFREGLIRDPAWAQIVEDMEYYGKPATWWVSAESVLGVLDRTWETP